MTTPSPTAMPHLHKHLAEAFVCPCCGQSEETNAAEAIFFGAQVTQIATCPECEGAWKNEWRIHATTDIRTGEAVLAPNDAMAALLALKDCSWLEPDPCDSDELAAAKAQALKAINEVIPPI